MTKNSSQTLIICPPTMKQRAIEIESSYTDFQNIKIMSTNELKENLFFSYNKEALIFMCETYNFQMSFAKDLIKYLYYINANATYEHQKLIFLQEIKENLTNNNLLKENTLFKTYLKKVHVSFRYFVNDTAEVNWLMNEVSKYTTVSNDSITTLEYKNINTIYEFNTLEEECIYLFDSFAKLIDEGVNPENIILLNPTADSIFTLDRISKFYNIAIDLPKKTKLCYTLICKEFIDLAKSSSIEYALNIIKEKYNNDVQSIKIVNKILNIVNEYSYLSNFEKYKKYIINDLKEAKISENKITNAIQTNTLDSYIYRDNDYVFIMNANYGVIDTIYKDDGYLSDELKTIISMPTSKILNEEEKQFILNKISKLNLPVVTYHLSTPFTIAFPSFLNDYISKKYIIKNPTVDLDCSYSKINDIYSLIKKEELKHFDEEYNYLNKNLREYIKGFNPSYTPIDKEKIYKYYLANRNHLRLSYSSMNIYYQCPFRFYLEKILKLDDFESSFAIKIGNIFHDVLSQIYRNDFNLDDSYEKACNKYEFTVKELFLLKKLKSELAFDISVIKEHHATSTSFTNQKFEKKIILELEKRNDLSLSFEGIIDKAMYYEKDDKNYLSIVDYKTGEAEINLENIENGVGMQLPTYLYLANKSDLFKGYKFAGFYLQPILANELPGDPKKTRDDLRKEYLKLVGYSIKDPAILSQFDNTYVSSKYIKSMSYPKSRNDFGAYAKVMDEQQMQNLVDLVDKKINNAFDSILNADFKINPYINKKNEKEGCKYCKYSDICYKNFSKEVLNDGRSQMDRESETSNQEN